MSTETLESVPAALPSDVPFTVLLPEYCVSLERSSVTVCVPVAPFVSVSVTVPLPDLYLPSVVNCND